MRFLSVTLTLLRVTSWGVTVNTVEPVTPWKLATIPEVPGPTPVARPAAVTLATLGADEFRVT
jgi:hypothetical protein